MKKGLLLMRKALLWIIALGIAGWVVVVYIHPYLNESYGLNTATVALVFLVAEMLFDFGIVMMLWFGLGKKANFQAIKAFKPKEFRADWRNPGVVFGLAINRISWMMPFGYVLWVGWGKMPWFVLSLCVVEIAITAWIGLIAIGCVNPKNKTKIVVRAATARDIDQVLAVDRYAWGKIFPGNRKMFEKRMETFPEGGIIVAEVDGTIVAFGSTQIIHRSAWFSDHTDHRKSKWDTITDMGTMRLTHSDDGDWFYGVGLASTKEGARCKAVDAIFTHVGKLVITYNKKGMILASRMPGLHKSIMEPRDYVSLTRNGRPIDPELRIYHAAGVKVTEPPILIKDYMGPGTDPESCGWSVLVEWHNPFYNKPFWIRWIFSKLFKA